MCIRDRYGVLLTIIKYEDPPLSGSGLGVPEPRTKTFVSAPRSKIKNNKKNNLIIYIENSDSI